MQILAAILALGLTAASAAPPSAENQHLVYTISRDGSPIGQQTVDIAKKGRVTTVNVASDIDVKVLFVSAYTFRYTGRETWTDDQLEAFTSQTDDNGTQHRVSAQLNDDKLEVDADGQTRTVPKTDGVDDFWSPKLLSKTTVLDTEDGHQMTFTVQDLGMQTMSFRGNTTDVHHFKLTGDLNEDLWFDSDALVRVQFKTKEDGSLIVFELQ